jgi:hypothetical protein
MSHTDCADAFGNVMPVVASDKATYAPAWISISVKTYALPASPSRKEQPAIDNGSLVGLYSSINSWPLSVPTGLGNISENTASVHFDTEGIVGAEKSPPWGVTWADGGPKVDPSLYNGSDVARRWIELPGGISGAFHQLLIVVPLPHPTRSAVSPAVVTICTWPPLLANNPLEDVLSCPK